MRFSRDSTVCGAPARGGPVQSGIFFQSSVYKPRGRARAPSCDVAQDGLGASCGSKTCRGRGCWPPSPECRCRALLERAERRARSTTPRKRGPPTRTQCLSGGACAAGGGRTISADPARLLSLRRRCRSASARPGVAIFCDQRGQLGQHAGHQSPAPVDQRGVELQRGGAGPDLGIGIGARRRCRRRRPAAARRRSAGTCGRVARSRAASSGAPLSPPASPRCAAAQRRGAGERGVADDQPVDAGCAARSSAIARSSSGVEVGRDLQQDRLGAGPPMPARAVESGRAARLKLAAMLQVAQARRVGRRDVDRDVVDQADRARAGRHIVRRSGRRRRGWRRYWRRSRPSRARAHASRCPHPLQAVAVEAQAVDQCAVLRQPEQPWPRIAGLGLGRHRADLDEAEAEPCARPAQALRVLVEPGGEA